MSPGRGAKGRLGWEDWWSSDDSRSRDGRRGTGEGRERWPREQPDWWPEGENWPPRRRRRSGRRGSRRGPRPQQAIGCGCGFLLFVLFAVVGAIALVSLVVTRVTPLDGGLAEGATFGVWVLLILLVLVILAASAFLIARIVMEVNRVSRAVTRLEESDFSARVPEPSWSSGPLRSLVRAFNTMAERLEEDEETRRTLLADVSHELRNPLAVIQGELEAIQDGVHTPDEARIATLLGEVEVLSRLVDDLRTVTLAEAGTLALHPEPTDLGVLIEDVAGSYAGLAANDEVELTTEVADSLPLIEVDPLRIREVLTNLVSNAVRHAGRPGTVRVVASETAGSLEIAVVDSGAGIDPDVLPRVFERFAKDAASPGFGLGLAIARGLVEAHGGTLSASSEVGAGTTMVVRLPLGAPEAHL